ncbi:uncharacterized protein [Macrobrachium rosenbergii]|uniref:uncharacterized protein n=1 Tax=Macrobrachium rosenbergii TaxID=79674 RepID=UPI0034D521FA
MAAEIEGKEVPRISVHVENLQPQLTFAHNCRYSSPLLVSGNLHRSSSSSSSSPSASKDTRPGAMKLPVHITGGGVVSARNAPGLLLLLGFITGFQSVQGAPFPKDPSAQGNEFVPGLSHKWKRSTNTNAARGSRYLGFELVKLRLSGGYPFTLYIENGSIRTGIGREQNSVSCLKKHKFQLPLGGPGEKVILESGEGGAFLSVDAQRELGVQVDASGNIDAISQTDNRLFRVFMRPGERAARIKNLNTEMFLAFENSTFSAVPADHVASRNGLSAFEFYPC